MRLVIPIEPVPKGRPRVSKNGGVYTPEKTRAFEDEFRWRLINEVKVYPLFINCPLKVDVTFYLKPPKIKRALPCVKPDIDNLIKSLDACNGILWVDDAQIVTLTARKRYGEPRIELEVELG